MNYCTRCFFVLLLHTVLFRFLLHTVLFRLTKEHHGNVVFYLEIGSAPLLHTVLSGLPGALGASSGRPIQLIALEQKLILVHLSG